MYRILLQCCSLNINHASYKISKNNYLPFHSRQAAHLSQHTLKYMHRIVCYTITKIQKQLHQLPA